MRVVFVHGACVRDGAWWWHRTAEILEHEGIGSVAATLPSCGEAGSPAGADGPGLADDVASLRRTLADGADTVVVAHSYGGIVAAEGLTGVEGVRHLVLVSSYLPEAGESLSSFGDGTPAPFLDVDPDTGTFGVRPDALVETFLQDCPPDVGDEARHHLARQSVSVIGAPVTDPGWRAVPTTYLVCTDDRGTPAAAQRRYAARADTVVEIEAGHHPFLSRPGEVAELLRGLA